MHQNTHRKINESLMGKVTRIEDGFAEVWLHTSVQMAADEFGLVHGGFVFGAADYAAMCAVNDPNVVLGASSSKFIAPVKVGDAVKLTACVVETKGKKSEVSVKGSIDDKVVYEGSFTAFVLEKHVLG